MGGHYLILRVTTTYTWGIIPLIQLKMMDFHPEEKHSHTLDLYNVFEAYCFFLLSLWFFSKAVMVLLVHSYLRAYFNM